MEESEKHVEELNFESLIQEEADFPVVIFGPGPVRRLEECMSEEYSGNIFDAVLVNCENCEYRRKCFFHKRVVIAKQLQENLKGYPVIIELESFRNDLNKEFSFMDIIEDLIIQGLEKDEPLLIIFPESPGSQAEFNIFYRSPLKNRIRLIVKKDFNPLYNREIGFLSSLYLTFLGETGFLFVYWRHDQLELLVERIVDSEVKSRFIRSKKLKYIP